MHNKVPASPDSEDTKHVMWFHQYTKGGSGDHLGGFTVAYDPEQHKAGIALCCSTDAFGRVAGRYHSFKCLTRVEDAPPARAARFDHKIALDPKLSNLDNLALVAAHVTRAALCVNNETAAQLAVSWSMRILTRKRRQISVDECNKSKAVETQLRAAR